MRNDAAAQAFLDTHVRRARVAEVTSATAQWRFATGSADPRGRRVTSDEVARAHTELKQIYADPVAWAELQRLQATPPADPALNRQLQLLSHHFAAHQMRPDLIAHMAQLETSIEERFISFRPGFEGGSASDNDLKRVLILEDAVPRRREAWEASKKIGAEVADDVRQFIRLRNTEAHRLGYRDYYAMSLAHQELSEARLLATLEEVRVETEGPYTALKARLDAHLRRRFGLDEHAPLYPWHYPDPFFQDCPPEEEGLDLDPLFADVDPVEVARRFFTALGLEVDPILARSDLYERPGKNQHAFCTRLDREGDVRILVNLRADEGCTSTLLHELGHAVYDAALPNRLPWVLRDVSHTLMTEAIALLMGRMTRDGAWLERYLGLPADEARRIGVKAAAALRDQQLVFSRWCLVMVHFERAMYADPEQDLDALWWQTVARFQKITPPPGRHQPDWASKIHLANVPVYYQNYLLGEMVASQLWDTLLGRVVAGMEEPRAAAVGHEVVGRFLTEQIFTPGASRPWTEHLAQATGAGLDSRFYTRLLRGELS